MSNQEKPQGRSAQGGQASPNPAQIFIQWKSKNEKFSYWSKEKEEDVLLPMPFSFIPLYIAYTVKGYNHKKTKTFISNEIESLDTDILTVRSYNSTNKEKKVEHTGLYSDIKESFDSNVKFTISLYAAIKSKKGELSLVNLQLNGAGLHHWFDFTKKNDIWKNAVQVDSTTDEINGTVKYKAPVYKAVKISQEDDIKAGELQETIKSYLKEYFAKNGAEAPKPVVNEKQNNGLNKTAKKEEPEEDNDVDVSSILEDDDLPF